MATTAAQIALAHGVLMDEDPIDLQALHADDDLIEDIAAGRVDMCDDDLLTALLAAWVGTV